MYAALWSHLPGPPAVKGVLALALLAGVLALLLLVVFPWAAQFVPGYEVSVG
jgi:hypothetical protein